MKLLLTEKIFNKKYKKLMKDLFGLTKEKKKLPEKKNHSENTDVYQI
jgi:hypothetical protein